MSDLSDSITNKHTVSLKRWRMQSSRVLFEHPRLTVAEDTVELPNGKTTQYIHYPYHGQGGVIVVCHRGDSILVQQEYSYPVDEVLYQFPGGKIEAGEDVCAAAQRELAEESGIAMTGVRACGWLYADNRRTSAKLHVVYGEYAGTNHQHRPDDTEQIISQWLPIATIHRMVATGVITNYAMLAAWALLASTLQQAGDSRADE